MTRYLSWDIQLTDVDSFGAAIGICRAANALGEKGKCGDQ